MRRSLDAWRNALATKIDEDLDTVGRSAVRDLYAAR
jgi:hypothetical protein